MTSQMRWDEVAEESSDVHNYAPRRRQGLDEDETVAVAGIKEQNGSAATHASQDKEKTQKPPKKGKGKEPRATSRSGQREENGAQLIAKEDNANETDGKEDKGNQDKEGAGKEAGKRAPRQYQRKKIPAAQPNPADTDVATEHVATTTPPTDQSNPESSIQVNGDASGQQHIEVTPTTETLNPSETPAQPVASSEVSQPDLVRDAAVDPVVPVETQAAASLETLASQNPDE
eukprot:TRINITY_DN833_c0_g2_i7.p2 TRINITY_DN833_c0_g2~~TRINITY_DN833_c0_g2_i7.p2  ORF type:complete len:231 (+),score=56.73 TRINITY_DN833_c0_g2_i7:2275-2967(+)